MEGASTKSFHEIAADLVRWFDFFSEECFAFCVEEKDKDNTTIGNRYYTESGEECNFDDIVTAGGCEIVINNTNEFINETLSLLDIGLGTLASYLQGVCSEKGNLSLLDEELCSKFARFLFDVENDKALEETLFSFENYYYLIKEIKRWKDYFEVFKEQRVAGIKEPQQENDLEAVCDDVILPSGLDNDEARELFKRAIKAGLMEKVEGGFRWKKENALLAYFCGIIFCEDIVVEDEVIHEKIVKRGSLFFPDKALSSLFNVKNLGQSRLQLKSPPRGHEIIDRLF